MAYGIMRIEKEQEKQCWNNPTLQRNKQEHPEACERERERGRGRGREGERQRGEGEREGGGNRHVSLLTSNSASNVTPPRFDVADVRAHVGVRTTYHFRISDRRVMCFITFY